MAKSNKKTRPAKPTSRTNPQRRSAVRARPAENSRANPKYEARKKSKNAPAGGFKVLFPKLARSGNRFGIGVLVARAVRDGGAPTLKTVRLEEAFAKPGLRPRTALIGRLNPKKASTILTGMAHPDRIRVAAAIMTGSNTHKLLKESLKLAAGPLYHHLRALQMANLVALASRNFYVLTELGETILLIAVCVTRIAGGA
ncbi:MAG: hypothetical protein AABZ08_11065 [Planctomycetota bacterium]